MRIGKYRLSFFSLERIEETETDTNKEYDVVSVEVPNETNYHQFYFNEIRTDDQILKIWHWTDRKYIGDFNKLEFTFFAPGKWNRIFSFVGRMHGDTWD